MTTINTKNITELQAAFDRVLANWNLSVMDGIVNCQIKLEDGLPWFTLFGDLPKSAAKKITQDLANELNIRVLLNRSEKRPNELTVYGVLDIDYNVLKEQGPGVPLPALSNDPDAADFMADYGKPFLPKN